MRRARFIFGFLAIFSGFVMAPAEAKTLCPSTTPALYFKSATSPVQYIQNQSSEILTQIHGAKAPGEGAVGGLGGGEIGFKTELAYEIFTRAQEACVVLKAVTVILYTKPKIQIASNFKRGSCEYEAILEHEREHVAILQAFAKEKAPEARSYFFNVLRRIKPVIGPIRPAQSEKAQVALQNAFQSHVEAYNERILPALMQRQIAIDTPEEYARVSRKCKNWGNDAQRSR
jgi:hypothetical protein